MSTTSVNIQLSYAPAVQISNLFEIKGSGVKLCGILLQPTGMLPALFLACHLVRCDRSGLCPMCHPNSLWTLVVSTYSKFAADFQLPHPQASLEEDSCSWPSRVYLASQAIAPDDLFQILKTRSPQPAAHGLEAAHRGRLTSPRAQTPLLRRCDFGHLQKRFPASRCASPAHGGSPWE